MGIHINGDHNIVGDNNTVVYEGDYGGPPRPPAGFVGLFFFALILVALVIKFWWIALIVVSASAIAFVTHLERQEKRQAEVEARRREQALAARAEGQNSAYLRGESWGTYGSFPPAVDHDQITQQEEMP